MKIFMDLGLSALFLHCMHAIYIQMSQSRYVKFENRDMSKFSQLLRPIVCIVVLCDNKKILYLDSNTYYLNDLDNNKQIIS